MTIKTDMEVVSSLNCSLIFVYITHLFDWYMSNIYIIV